MSDDKSMPALVGETWQLVVTYAKQETIDPIKRLGRFIVFGVSGSVFLGIGFVLLLLGGLRAAQTETGTSFTGNLSWLPYLFGLVVAGLLAALFARLITRRKDGP